MAVFTGKRIEKMPVIVEAGDKFNGCSFEDLYIDDSCANEDTFKHCYFENVKFASKSECFGIPGQRMFPSPVFCNYITKGK
jgi:hypothetical protein